MANPNGTNFEIGYGAFRAEITEVGATLRLFEVAGAPFTESFGEDKTPPLGCGQILVPWPNRVADGRWQLNGVSQQLDLSEPARTNAIHGLVRHVPWQLVEHVESRVVLQTDIAVQPGWPVPLRTAISYTLDADGLTVTNTVQNLGDQAIPFGVGSHVYPRTGNVETDDCTLRLAATTHLPVDAERLLPNGPEHSVAGTDLDFTTARSLLGVRLDDAFGGCLPGADGKVRHVLTGPQHAIQLWADPVFRWVQVFTATDFPQRGRAIAIEPMTCPPDALNSGVDLITLPPNDTWSASWGLQPNLVASN